MRLLIPLLVLFVFIGCNESRFRHFVLYEKKIQHANDFKQDSHKHEMHKESIVTYGIADKKTGKVYYSDQHGKLYLIGE